MSSAEWIIERPELVDGTRTDISNLAAFGVATISAGTATTSSGTGSIAALGGNAIEMISSTRTFPPTVLALPSGLDPTGEYFTDTYESSS